MSEERKKILDMVSSGKISPDEGAALLRLVSVSDEEETADTEQQPPLPEGEAQGAAEPTPAHGADTAAVGPGPEGQTAARVTGGAGRAWLYPLWAGLLLLLVGGTVVLAMHEQQRANAGTWLCGWIPLFVGLTIVTLAAWSRTAHWIHLRVRDHETNIALSLPLPLGLAAATVRLARPFVPQLRDTAVDEAILALRDGLEGNEDITIDVQDDDQGESVQIDFGGKQ
jgi:hypothetical protein